MKYHYIYRIDFLLNKGAYYIGKRSVNYLPQNDNSYLGSGIYPKRYFSKYGVKNTYIKTILETNPTKEINAEREKILIGDLWKTDVNCKNLEPGGTSTGGSAKKNVSGNKNPFYNKQHSESSKELMSKAALKRFGKEKYSVKCFDLNGNFIKEYSSRIELKNDGFNPKCIDNVLAGRAKTHKNFIFK